MVHFMMCDKIKLLEARVHNATSICDHQLQKIMSKVGGLIFLNENLKWSLSEFMQPHISPNRETNVARKN